MNPQTPDHSDNNPKLKGALKATAFVIAGMFMGAIVACEPPMNTASDKEPEVITETVTEEVEVEVVKEVEVEVASAVCVDALAAGDRVINLGADVMFILSDAFQGPVIDMVTAASIGDVAGMEGANADVEEMTGKVEKITKQIEASDYLELKEKCLAATTK